MELMSQLGKYKANLPLLDLGGELLEQLVRDCAVLLFFKTRDRKKKGEL